jgi:hypothetical protein
MKFFFEIFVLKKFEKFDKKFKKRARTRSLERVPVTLLAQASPR